MPATLLRRSAQPIDDVVGALAAARISRLQMDDQLTQIRAAQRLRGAAANRRHQPFDVRIVFDDFGNSFLILDQLVVRRALAQPPSSPRFGRCPDPE